MENILELVDEAGMEHMDNKMYMNCMDYIALRENKSPKMPADTSVAAAQKVLAIPELLENVLNRLPMEDLFVLQRVNSTFQGVIKKSKITRQTMFLEIPTDECPYGVFPGLFTIRAPNDTPAYARPSLQRATSPLSIRYHGIREGRLRFSCNSDYCGARSWDELPVGTSRASWRDIKLGRADLPILVRTTRVPIVSVQMGPMATFGQLADELAREWGRKIEQEWRLQEAEDRQNEADYAESARLWNS